MRLIGAETYHLAIFNQRLIEPLAAAIDPAAAWNPLTRILVHIGRIACRRLLIEQDTAYRAKRGRANRSQSRPFQQASPTHPLFNGRCFQLFHCTLLLSYDMYEHSNEMLSLSHYHQRNSGRFSSRVLICIKRFFRILLIPLFTKI